MDHELYVNNLVGMLIKANPRDFYRYITVRKNVQGIRTLKKRNGSGLAKSDFEKAGEFNDQFTKTRVSIEGVKKLCIDFSNNQKLRYAKYHIYGQCKKLLKDLLKS